MEYIKLMSENLEKNIFAVLFRTQRYTGRKQIIMACGKIERRSGLFKIFRTRKMLYRIHNCGKRLVPYRCRRIYTHKLLLGLGSFKGHGYANDLLNACIADAKAKGKHGITVVSPEEKCRFCPIRNI